MIISVAIGMLAGYVFQNYIGKIPVVNKLPVLGSK